jgi:hypothetical protein
MKLTFAFLITYNQFSTFPQAGKWKCDGLSDRFVGFSPGSLLVVNE